MSASTHWRIAMDSGGTFTDIIAFSDRAGKIVHSKVPSTPIDPSQAFFEALDALAEDRAFDPADAQYLFHGTTIATNAILEKDFPQATLLVTRGFRHILEIARQSVPGAYGDVYFWVKPERIVPLERVHEIPERINHQGSILVALDEEAVRETAKKLRAQGTDTVAVSFLHSYANPAHEQQARNIIKTAAPELFVSISSDVLSEYREYERAMSTVLDALVKPLVSQYLRLIDEGLMRSSLGTTSFMIMKSDGGVASAVEAAQKPVSTFMSGPAAGVFGAIFVGGLCGAANLLSLDMGGTSSDICLVENGQPKLTRETKLGEYPLKTPMVDIISVGTGGGSVAWCSPDRTLKVGPRSAGADPGPACYDKQGEEPTVTDANLVLGRLPAHLLGGEIPLSAQRARQAIASLGEKLGLSLEQTAAGIIDVASHNMVNGIREVSTRRGCDPRDYVLCAFGGAGPLMAGRLAEILGITTVIIPPLPGLTSAFGLLTTDIKNDYVQTSVQRLDRPDLKTINQVYSALERKATEFLDVHRVPMRRRTLLRSADLRYAGQAYEVQVDVPAGDISSGESELVVDRFHAAHERQFDYCYREEMHPVELVNLRVTAVGHLNRPTLPRISQGDGDPRSAQIGMRNVFFRNLGKYVDCPVFRRDQLRAGDSIRGPAIVEQYDSTVVIYPSQEASVDEYGCLKIVGPGRGMSDGALTDDAIASEIVKGTIDSTVREIEAAIERTARSPLIRDQHDYRAGIHDHLGRKISGQSYSAMVEPVFHTFPLDQIHEGDVFLFNDVYLSEGGITHLPDLCVTLPVFCEGDSVAYVQFFGHHDDVGGMVPGSMPTQATSVFQEGLMIPPIKIYDRGILNEAALAIMTRNSRLPASLRGDLDAEIAACQIGVRRLSELFDRYGKDRVKACFQRELEKSRRAFEEEIFPKIPDGRYSWFDFIESDGITPGKLHKLAVTVSKHEGKMTIDFTGTDPEARGPINWPIDYCGGRFIRRWLASVLKILAGPERAAEIDVNDGIEELIDVVFPPPGTLLTPLFPAPTCMRMFAALRLIGVFCGAIAQAVDGYMPADLETIRFYGIHGRDASGEMFLFREVLGGGGGGRWYADGSDAVHMVPNSRNLPAEFLETQYPILVERLALCPDSGGPGRYRGGLGYLKELRVLVDAVALSNADRSILHPWGIRGGKAGGPFRISINPGTSGEKVLSGLADDVPLEKGALVRVITTGGGGWGNPLEREPERVRVDVVRGLVSVEAARSEYGVVLNDGPDFEIDRQQTAELRAQKRKEGLGKMFDRGVDLRRHGLGGNKTTCREE